jgi:hypothetical protein
LISDQTTATTKSSVNNQHAMSSHTPRTLGEKVDCFAVSFILFPCIRLPYLKWKSAIEERYSNYVSTTISTFAFAKLLSDELLLAEECAELSREFIDQHGLRDEFESMFCGESELDCLAHMNTWVRFMRSKSLAPRIRHVVVIISKIWTQHNEIFPLHMCVSVVEQARKSFKFGRVCTEGNCKWSPSVVCISNLANRDTPITKAR